MKPIVKHQTLVMALLCGCVGSSDPELGEGATSTSGGDSTTTSSGEGIPTTGGEDNSTTAGVDCNDAAPCDGICCEPGELCSAGACLIAGAACSDLEACPEGQYCDYGLGGAAAPADACAPGAPALAGLCVAQPKLCAPGVDPLNADENCAGTCSGSDRNSGPLDLRLKYEWKGPQHIATNPIVIQLDDDNCNSKIDGLDNPEIVVASVPDIINWWEDGATLHALSVRNGIIDEIWSETPDEFNIRPWSMAAGNVDGKPGNEIVVCGGSEEVAVYSSDGSLLWLNLGQDQDCLWPSLGDYSGNGDIGIITSSLVLSGKDGSPVLGPFEEVTKTYGAKRAIMADLNADGVQELVLPNKVLDFTGKTLLSTQAQGSLSALADIDLDGGPELVVSHGDGVQMGKFSIWKYSVNGILGSIPVRQGLAVNGPLPASVCPDPSSGYDGTQAGAPTLGDVNLDGVPDILVAGGRGIVAFDGLRLMRGDAEEDSVLWAAVAPSCKGGAGGSVVFDLDGDGDVEVLFNDTQTLHIYDGATGGVLAEVCNIPGAALGTPIVADIDGDGRAEIVVSSQGHPVIECVVGDENFLSSGIRVFDVPGQPWTITGRVWNEELYRITNIEDDGSIPASPKVNWKEPGLNGFRANLQIPVERLAPDLRSEVVTDCAAEKFRAIARIGNAGQALAPAGVVVEFYEGTPEEGQLLGTAQTTAILGPGQVEDVMLELGTVPDGLEDGSTKLTVRVVTDALLLPQGECNIENNLVIIEEACK